MRIGVVDLGSQGVHVSDTQAEALNQGLTYLNQARKGIDSPSCFAQASIQHHVPIESSVHEIK